MAERKYVGPPDQANTEVGRQNPEKGALLVPGETYTITGDALKELDASPFWEGGRKRTEVPPDPPEEGMEQRAAQAAPDAGQGAEDDRWRVHADEKSEEGRS